MNFSGGQATVHVHTLPLITMVDKHGAIVPESKQQQFEYDSGHAGMMVTSLPLRTAVAGSELIVDM